MHPGVKVAIGMLLLLLVIWGIGYLAGFQGDPPTFSL